MWRRCYLGTFLVRTVQLAQVQLCLPLTTVNCSYSLPPSLFRSIEYSLRFVGVTNHDHFAFFILRLLLLLLLLLLHFWRLLQDNEAAWNNSSPWLNDCFQKTVLVWLPPSWLLLSLPVLIGSLIKSKASFAWNAFNVLRQVVATALLLVTLADLVVVAAVLPPENKLTADLVNALLNLLFAVSPPSGEHQRTAAD